MKGREEKKKKDTEKKGEIRGGERKWEGKREMEKEREVRQRRQREDGGNEEEVYEIIWIYLNHL